MNCQELSTQVLINNTVPSQEQGDFHLSGLVIATLKSKSKGNSPYRVRTILDSGAGTNFISETILPHIKHEYLATKTLNVTGINSSENKSMKLVKVFIDNKGSQNQHIKCYTIPSMINFNIDENNLRKFYKHFVDNCAPKGTQIPQIVADHGTGIGLVLGPGTIREISTENPKYIKEYLVDFTIFGPAVSGKLPPNELGNISMNAILQEITSVSQSVDCLLAEVNDLELSAESDIDRKLDLLGDLQFLHDKEILGIKQDELHNDDLLCIQQFKNSIVHDQETKKYIVSLPFNSKKSKLPTNEYKAMQRTKNLQRQFLKDREYGLMYHYQIQSLLDLDKIEEVLPDTPTGDLIHYLPHRGIKKSDSKTTSLRVVMDASCREKSTSVSLNDCLYTGPNLVVNMCKLLLRFRQDKYGACSDIEKAFLNVVLREADRDVLRFFFPKDIFDPKSPMRVLRYKCVMFGANSSPFLLAAVIESHIDRHVKDRILQQSLKNIFIDNMIATANTEEELLRFYRSARSVFADMGLNLRQWSSNSTKVNMAAKEDGVYEQSSKVKVLGFLWEPETDKIHYNSELQIKPKHAKKSNYTKRIVLSLGQQIKDTFGFLLPEEMRYREFLQHLWTLKGDWDQSFEHHKDLVEQWDSILLSINNALNVSVDRTLQSYLNVELHVFSDASRTAYGAVAYMVIPPCPEFPNGLTQIRFAKGKVVSRTAYPKRDTIPKLELTSIVMAAFVANQVLDAHPHLQFTRKIIWNDSRAVLAQCEKPVNKDNYVNNRVIDIRALCPGFELRYIPSSENPADQITKVVKTKNRKDLWWNGPDCITKSDKWDAKDSFNLFPDGAEVEHARKKKQSVPLEEFSTHCGIMQIAKPSTPDRSAYDIMWTHGHYRKCIAFFSGIKVFVETIKSPNKREEFPTYTGCLPNYKISHLKSEGETLAIKTMQRNCFSEILETLEKGKRVTANEFLKLKLFLDDKGIIRIHGRLADEFFKHSNKPILFGYRHPLTVLFILDRHRLYNCSPVDFTLNKIRREIHSVKLRRQIREIIHRCIPCRRLIGKPFKYPQDPPLEAYRTRCSRPFYTCGVDFIGPFQVCNSGNITKVYIIIFSCLVSRAIYLSLVADRTTETFLRSLTGLSARHCEPALFISDNEGAFKKANKVLHFISKSVAFKNTGITWKFLPSRASWMGGVYERLVQIIKIELMKIQNKAQFNLMEWRSHLAEVESLVNDRPLTYVSDDAENPEVITPKAIIHGCLNETNLATDTNIDKAIIAMKELQSDPVKLYRDKQKLKEQFHNKLYEEYIQALNVSAYRKNKSQGKYCRYIPEVGGVVSIKDPDVSFGGRLAYITKLIPSSDGLIRKVEVKTTVPNPRTSLTKNLKTVHRIKAINHLIPLELKVEMDEHPVNTSLNGNLCRNMENPIPDTQTSDGIYTNVTWNLENPHPTNICQRLEFDVQPHKGEPCGLPNCKKPKPTKYKNVKLVQCTNTDCETWCHYTCAGIPYTTTFTAEQIYICPLCTPTELPHRKQQEEHNDSKLNNRGLPYRKTALEANKKLKQGKRHIPAKQSSAIRFTQDT